MSLWKKLRKFPTEALEKKVSVTKTLKGCATFVKAKKSYECREYKEKQSKDTRKAETREQKV